MSSKERNSNHKKFNQMQKQTQKKAIVYTPQMAEFLTLKGIEFFTTDADILCFEIQSDEHNDTEFFQLAMEYSVWSRSSKYDREQIAIANDLRNQFFNRK